jgi:predicted O-methyltransferase YrrM
MNHFYNNVVGAFTFPNLYYSAVNFFNDAEFVEVGVNYGQSACFMGVEIINQNKNIKLNLVDSWDENFAAGMYDSFLNSIQPVKNVLQDRLNIIRDLSVNASKKFKNESLDFIFIDACHDYECVIEDLNAWYPKLKKGGIIAGHDYYDGHAGVEKAVNEFFYSKFEYLHSQEHCWIFNNK